MTQSVAQVRNIVARTGFVNPLPLGVLVSDSTYLEVYADEELLTEGPDYVVSGVGDDDGVTIEIIGADDPDNYVGYETFTVVYTPPIDQQADLSAGGNFGRAFETALDQQNRRVQAVADRTNRAIKLPVNIDGDIVTPAPVDGYVLVWNDATQSFDWTSPAPENSAAAAAIAAAAEADAAAVSAAASAAEAAAAAAASAGKQDADTDLTAIAALATQAYGRSLLTLASSAALAAEVDAYFLTPAEGAAAFQPLDGDLIAIAALTTQAHGRALLTKASAADVRAAESLPVVVQAISDIVALDPAKDLAAFLIAEGSRGIFRAVSLSSLSAAEQAAAASDNSNYRFVYIIPTADATKVYRRVLGADGAISPEWAGIIPATTTIIQAALTLVALMGGGAVALDRTLSYTWASKVTVPATAELVGNGATIKPNADIDLIDVNGGGRVRGVVADCSSATLGFAYTKTFITVQPTVNLNASQYRQPMVESCEVAFDVSINATVTITIASPAVISWTAHGLKAGSRVRFTTTGALPTGLTAGTDYYVISAGLATDSFRVSATSGGAAVNTSGSQSGTHTAQYYSGGNGIVLNAATYHIQEVTCRDLVVYGGAIGAHLIGGASATQYNNGNLFYGLTCHSTLQTILEDYGQAGTCTGNRYEIFTDANQGRGIFSEIKLSDLSFVTGSIWDSSTLNFQGSDNIVIGDPLIISNDTITADSGRNNLVIATNGTYFDHTSQNRYGDQRNSRLSLPGLVQFYENFQGGAAQPQWGAVAAGAGGGTPTGPTFAVTSFGTNADLSGVRARIGTGSTSGNDMSWSWQLADIKPGHYPVIGADIYLPSAAAGQLEQFGLWGSASDYILFETDYSNNRWVAKVKSTATGHETTSNFACSFSTTRMHRFRIIVEPTKVLFEYGNPTTNSGQVGIGTSSIGTGGFSAPQTISADIPTGVFLKPWFYVKTTTVGTNMVMDVLNFFMKRAFLKQ